MQIIISCLGCAKRYVTNDARLAKEMVCPVCGGAMKSAPRLNLAKPTKSHIVEDLPDYPMAELPASDFKLPKPPIDPTKRVIVFGSVAVGLILVFGIGWITYSSVFGEKSPVAVWSGDGPPKSSGASSGAESDEAEGRKSSDAAVVPTFGPTAPPPAPEKPKATKTPAEVVLEKTGAGVVQLTALDADGKPRGTGSGAIVARRRTREWFEKDAAPSRTPPQGDAWFVATTYRTIAGASDVEVRLRDGTVRRPRGLAAADRSRDLALLELDAPPKDLLVLEAARETLGRPGDDVFALGYQGSELIAAAGKIAQLELPDDLREFVRAPSDQRWIRSTAAPGSAGCGGPLVNAAGKLIGLNSWSYDDGGPVGVAIADDNVQRFVDSTSDEELGLFRIAVLPLSAAPTAEATIAIGEKTDWTEAEVRLELDRATKRVSEIDWRPATKGDYIPLESLGKMLSVAAARGFASAERASLAAALEKRRWDFDTEINPINRFAVEGPPAEQRGAVFFGKVRRVNPAWPRRLAVDIVGRGFTVALTILPSVQVSNLEPGDDLLVLGYRHGTAPKGGALPRDAHELFAGLVVPATLPPLPTDIGLQEAYDLARFDRGDPAFADTARRFADTYERALPLVGKVGIRWQRLQLNGHGRQFDAVRLSVPPGLNCDLLWSFTSPEESIEAFGVLPVGEFPLREEGDTFTSQGQPVSQLTKDETQFVVLRSQVGGQLTAGDDYLLWFTFKDAKPRRVALAARLLPVGSFDWRNLASTGKAMQDGHPFAPAETARMLQLMKERAAAAAEAKTPKPTATPSGSAAGTGPAPTATPSTK